MDIKKVSQIIEKVRSMYKYDKEISKVLATNAQVKYFEEKGELKLVDILFDNYDVVCITKNKITFTQYGRSRVLIEYDNFENILNL